MLCSILFLFWFKFANEHREFRNYLEVNEDLQSIEEVIQNIDKEMEEYLQTQSFNESRVEFLNQHLTKVTVNKDYFLLEFDLIGGAILTGKDFYLFVDNPRTYGKCKIWYKDYKRFESADADRR